MADQETQTTSPRPVAGVWQRVWEEDPLGNTDGIDRETLVLWTQVPQSGYYVDLRLPIDSPGRSLESASKAGYHPTPAALAGRGLILSNPSAGMEESIMTSLFRQKSFAGVLTFSVGDTTTTKEALTKDAILADLAKTNGAADLPLCTCFWRRDIDYQPPSGGLDIGVCVSATSLHAKDGSIDLRETGEDGSYAELWRRLPGTFQGPFLALVLESENGFDRSGVWVQAGTTFAYAIGRPATASLAKSLECSDQSFVVRDCIGKSLIDATMSLSPEQRKDQLNIAGTYVAVVGTIECSGDAKSWQIEHSTHPELVGCSLVEDERIDHDPLCCSTLEHVLTESDKEANLGVLPGSIIDQHIHLHGEQKLIRRWKVVEMEGDCKLPGC